MFNIQIPIQVEKIIEALQTAGFKAYAVGGCIRDSILGNLPNDWDICTNALPANIKEILNEYKIVDTGLKHGTVTVICDKIPYEVTTFRSETTYSDNRHPDSVIFEDNIEQDLLRRDFTINALAYNYSEGLVDLFDGISDIKNKVIKTVGRADTRFNEDALRILRALRFSAVLEFSINNETKESIHRNSLLLKNVAYERIWSELRKLLLGNNAVNILEEFYDVIGVFIPEILPMVGFKQNNPYHCYDVWQHTLVALEHTNNDIAVILSVLLHDIGKPSTYFLDENGVGHFYGHGNESCKIADNILQRLRVDNKLKSEVLTLIKYHDIQINNTEKSIMKVIRKLGSEELFEKLLIVKQCDVKGQSKNLIDKRLKDIDEIKNIYISMKTKENYILTLKELNITGFDIMDLGIPKGKLVGDILKRLFEMVVNNQIPNQQIDLLNKVKEVYGDYIK